MRSPTRHAARPSTPRTTPTRWCTPRRRHSEHGSKVAETERRAIEDAVSDLKEALKGDDAEAIKAKTNTLAQASMKLGEAMYKQQAEADAAKDAAKDDVVDAEFTEVDDDKNNKKSA